MFRGLYAEFVGWSWNCPEVTEIGMRFELLEWVGMWLETADTKV